MSKLKVLSQKEKDYAELVRIVEAVETCTFVDPSKINTEREEIITVKPPRAPRLMKPDTKLVGWIVKKKTQDAGCRRVQDAGCRRAHTAFEAQMDKYQNNQYCYLQRLETGKMSEKETKKHLTELEMWFVKIIEPPPEKSEGSKYQDYLKKWLQREKTKYQFSRSYYCDDEAKDYLDHSCLNDMQSIIFQHYEEVREYFDNNCEK